MQTNEQSKAPKHNRTQQALKRKQHKYNNPEKHK